MLGELGWILAGISIFHGWMFILEKSKTLQLKVFSIQNLLHPKEELN